MAELAFLDVRTRAKWRAWLGKHHTSSRGVWVVFHQAHTGVKSMPYEDGQDRIRSAYPDGTWDRLARIKSTYDPNNLFRLNQNIEPALSKTAGTSRRDIAWPY